MNDFLSSEFELKSCGCRQVFILLIMRYIIISLFVLVIISSCRTPRYIYSPAPPEILYFQKKGDSKLSASYSSLGGRRDGESLQNEGFDGQAGYAIAEHWALTGSYFFRKEKDYYHWANTFFDTSRVSYDRHLINFGGGYFFPMNSRKTISANFFVGLGFGKFSINDKGIDRNYQVYSRFHDSKITKWYIQQGFNFMMKENIAFSLSGRFSFVHYSDISTSYTDDELIYFFLDKIKNKGIAFFEPTFHMQAGLPQCKWLKIEGGITEAFPFKDNYPATRVVCFSAGLCFDFSKFKK